MDLHNEKCVMVIDEHLGIIEFPVPILKGSPEIIKAIRGAKKKVNKLTGSMPLLR